VGGYEDEKAMFNFFEFVNNHDRSYRDYA